MQIFGYGSLITAQLEDIVSSSTTPAYKRISTANTIEHNVVETCVTKLDLEHRATRLRKRYFLLSVRKEMQFKTGYNQEY